LEVFSMFRKRLIAPGPVETSLEVGLAMAQPQLHHRSPEAKVVVNRARELLRIVAGLPLESGFEPLIVTASGTGAFEAALVSLVGAGSSLISVSSGKFGERWGDMSRALGYNVFEKRFEWGRAIDPEAVTALLQANPDARAVLVTHSETSTGTLNDVAAIARAAKAFNPEILVIVDAITSLGIAELRPQEWKLDAVISGSQKAVGGPPGLGFVYLSPDAIQTLENSKVSVYYWDLKKELKAQKTGETAYTPAINLIVGLNASLEPLASEISSVGLERFWANKKRLNDALLEAAKALGCSSFSDSPTPACVTIVPPAPITGRELFKALLERNARAMTGQDAIKDKIVRISFMGYFDKYDALAFAGLLEDALTDCGAKITPGAGVGALWRSLNA
jgi:aspartate aminotransferase-like enzyme